MTQEMALALMEDATQDGDMKNTSSDVINIYQFEKALVKHKGILDNLEISLFMPKVKRQSTKVVNHQHFSRKGVTIW